MRDPKLPFTTNVANGRDGWICRRRRGYRVGCQTSYQRNKPRPLQIPECDIAGRVCAMSDVPSWVDLRGVDNNEVRHRRWRERAVHQFNMLALVVAAIQHARI